MMNKYVPMALLAALVAGCGGEGVDPDSIDEPMDDIEGTSLNGVSLNGVSLNGVSLNGVSLNGVSLNGVSLNGVSLNGVSLNGTDFTSSTLSGPAFVGSKFNGTLSNGSTLVLKIDTRGALAAPNADVFSYAISYQTQSGWSPLCGMNGVTPIGAIPLKGTWNYAQGVVGGGSFTPDATKITFACRGTAIAKCVEMGYKPWKLVPGSASTTLQNHQVACTRMLRADYCGDGSPWTVTGTTLNLYDSVGIQTDTQGWTIEAEWTAAGARFISTQNDTRFTLLGKAKPGCFNAKKSSTTGDLAHFATGTLIMDEYNQ